MLLSTPIAESLSSAAALADELDRYRVLPRERLGEAMVDFPGGGSLGLAEFLIARGELTPYQAERTLSGQARSLLLGPYRILEPHHVGAFGPILRAMKGEAEFAVRVLPLRSLWQAKQAKQLVRTLASLKSAPAIVPLVDADSANGNHYLAWPLTPGELLSDRILTRGPMDSIRTTDLLCRLAAALASCHTCQVLHGLLTPNAVCIQRDGTPKLLEVGAGALLARNLASDDSLFDTMSASVAVAGAFDFAAPEWMADPTRATPAADQYSLGALGHFVITGAAPPIGGPVSWPNGVRRELAATLSRMLQPDPQARFSGLEEVWAALTELNGLGGVELVELDPSEQASRHSASRIAASGAAELEWPAAEPSLRPVERDNSDASVHFDLPETPQEESAPIGLEPFLGTRETPPPAQWQTAAHEPRPVPTPPPKYRLLDKVEVDRSLAPPPELPAAPLPPLLRVPDSSSTWEVDNRKSGGGSTSDDKPGSALWKRMKRKVLFWQSTGDAVQISVFGPKQTTHSESPRLTVFLHSPSTSDSVATLARAFHHDAELLGTAPLNQTVERGERLDVHVALAHMSVTNPLGAFTWKGQPHRLMFDFVVPWEAPVGAATAVVSVGRSDVRIGKLEFQLSVRDGTR